MAVAAAVVEVPVMEDFVHSVFTEGFGLVAAAINARDGLLPAGERAGWLSRGGDGEYSDAAQMRVALGEA